MKQLLLISSVILMVLNLIALENSATDHDNDPHLHSLESYSTAVTDTVPDFPYKKTEKEWKEILTSSEYRILRNKGTELPYVNEYNNSKEDGIYVCGGCGQILYDSQHKYDSGTGWPSFWKPISDSLVVELEDNSLWMTRTEIVCSNCGSHLGHVFDDGPEPTGLRYCMNSAAMDLVPRDSLNK